MSEIRVSVRDTSTIEVPIGASAAELSAVFSSLASDDEYKLTSAATIEVGQRDPYVKSVKMTFTKDQS